MFMLRRSLLRGYAIALLGAELLLVLDQSIASVELRNFALAVSFILAVVLSSAFGGWQPGLLATMLGVVTHLFAFVEPRYSIKLPDQRELLRISAYCVAGGSIICLSEALQRAWDRLRDRQQLLEQENRRKSEFLATLAHELRNPLAPLQSGMQVLRLAGGDQAVVEECLTMMERQLAHTVRLVTVTANCRRLDPLGTGLQSRVIHPDNLFSGHREVII